MHAKVLPPLVGVCLGSDPPSVGRWAFATFKCHIECRECAQAAGCSCPVPACWLAARWNAQPNCHCAVSWPPRACACRWKRHAGISWNPPLGLPMGRQRLQHDATPPVAAAAAATAACCRQRCRPRQMWRARLELQERQQLWLLGQPREKPTAAGRQLMVAAAAVPEGTCCYGWRTAAATLLDRSNSPASRCPSAALAGCPLASAGWQPRLAAALAVMRATPAALQAAASGTGAVLPGLHRAAAEGCRRQRCAGRGRSGAACAAAATATRAGRM